MVLLLRLVLLLLLKRDNTGTGGAIVNRRGKDATRGSPLLLAIKKVMMVIPLPPRMKEER